MLNSILNKFKPGYTEFISLRFAQSVRWHLNIYIATCKRVRQKQKIPDFVPIAIVLNDEESKS